MEPLSSADDLLWLRNPATAEVGFAYSASRSFAGRKDVVASTASDATSAVRRGARRGA